VCALANLKKIFLLDSFWSNEYSKAQQLEKNLKYLAKYHEQSLKSLWVYAVVVFLLRSFNLMTHLAGSGSNVNEACLKYFSSSASSVSLILTQLSFTLHLVDH
jgi:hypothetical protein